MYWTRSNHKVEYHATTEDVSSIVNSLFSKDSLSIYCSQGSKTAWFGYDWKYENETSWVFLHCSYKKPKSTFQCSQIFQPWASTESKSNFCCSHVFYGGVEIPHQIELLLRQRFSRDLTTFFDGCIFSFQFGIFQISCFCFHFSCFSNLILSLSFIYKPTPNGHIGLFTFGIAINGALLMKKHFGRLSH